MQHARAASLEQWPLVGVKSRLLLLPTDPVATASSVILFLFGFSCVEYELLTYAHTHHLETETQLCSLFSTWDSELQAGPGHP